MGESAINKPIPKEIGLLDKMLSLTVENANLTEEIPQELCECTDLTNLNLQWNALSGPVPECFHRLVNLQFLALDNNLLTVLLYESFSSLIQLEWLAVSHNGESQISANIPDIFANMTRLTRLDLSANNFRGPIPPSLSALKNLEFLALWYTPDLYGIMPDLTGSRITAGSCYTYYLDNVCVYPSQISWYTSSDCGLQGNLSISHFSLHRLSNSTL